MTVRLIFFVSIKFCLYFQTVFFVVISREKILIKNTKMDRFIIDLGHRDKFTELEDFIDQSKTEHVRFKYKNL